jgi:cytochrome c
MKGFTVPALCVGFFAASIGLAHLRPFGDPRNITEQQRIALTGDASMPDAAKRVLIEKCADCHSDATRWPLYSDIAPVSWLIEHDVVEGREHLNLSHWQELSPDRQQVLSQEIVQQVKRGTMPPLPYRLMHWRARLISADVATLTTLAADEALETTRAAPGDPVRGRTVFERRCTGCHALDTNREGPHLRGVYGRTAGSVPDFDYSSAIKKSGLVWNDANLERWLRGTDAMVPDSNMGFSVPKAQERADIIAFLKTMH